MFDYHKKRRFVAGLLDRNGKKSHYSLRLAVLADQVLSPFVPKDRKLG